MRKTRIIYLIFALLLICSILTGCSFFGDESDSTKDTGSNSLNTVRVNFYNGENVKTENLEIGKQFKVSLPIKNGYYLTGYYSEPEGGIQYFDVYGRSISVWSENYPTDLYAQWEPISGVRIYNIYKPDKTYESTGTLDANIWFLSSLDEFGILLVSANLNREVKITISYRVKEVYTQYYPTVKHYVTIKDSKESSGEVIHSTSYNLECGNYYDQVITFTCEARELSSGQLFVKIVSDSGYTFCEFAIKEFSLIAEFV